MSAFTFARIAGAVAAMQRTAGVSLPVGASVKVGVVTYTASSTADISVSVGFQPKAMLFWFVELTTSDLVGADMSPCYGVATGPGAQYAIGAGMDRGTAPTVAYSHHRADACLAQVQEDGTDGLRVGVKSKGSGGFVLEVLNASASGSTIMWMAIGGDDVVAEVGAFTEPAATGVQTVSLVNSFTPDVVFLLSACESTAPPHVRVDQALSFGIAAGSGGQCLLSTGMNSGGTSANHALNRTQCVGLFNDAVSSLDGRAGWSAFGAGSFALDWSQRASSRRLFYLAIGGVRGHIVGYDVPSSGSPVSHTGAPAQPLGGLVLGSMLASETGPGSLAAGSSSNVGVFTSPSAQYSVHNRATYSGGVSGGIIYRDTSIFQMTSSGMAATGYLVFDHMTSDGYVAVAPSNIAGGVNVLSLVLCPPA